MLIFLDMKRYLKILLCATITVALSFSLPLTAFARDIFINDYNDRIFFNLIQYNPDDPTSRWDKIYSSAEDMSGVAFAITPTESDLGSYIPMYCIAYDGFTGVGEQAYMYKGEGLLTKFFDSSESTIEFLEGKNIVTSFEVSFLMGFEQGPVSALPDEADAPIANLEFGGKIIDPSLYTLSRRRSSLLSGIDSNTGAHYRFRQYRYIITFNAPYELTSSDPWDYSFTGEFNWNGYAMEGHRILVGMSEFKLTYSLPDQYANGIIGNNNISIGGFKSEVENVLDDLNVDKVSGDDVVNIMGGISQGDIGDVGDLVGSFNHLEADSPLYSLLTLSLVTTAGIAFAGYALHGKRG